MSSKNMKRVFMLLLAAAAMMAFPSVSHMFGMGKPAEKITSFKIVTLRLSGMRFTTEYEIVMKDKEAEVVEYAIRYEKNEDKRIPQRQTVCSADRILKLLNDCELVSWDGFHGKHPKNVCHRQRRQENTGGRLGEFSEPFQETEGRIARHPQSKGLIPQFAR